MPGAPTTSESPSPKRPGGERPTRIPSPSNPALHRLIQLREIKKPKKPHNALRKGPFSECARASLFPFYACRYICPKSESASVCISIPSSALSCGFVTSLRWLSQKIPLPRYIPPLPPSDLRAILALLSNFTCVNLRFCHGRHRFICRRCLRVVK